MPGTKISGLFGFNRLSSDILFDICIEKTESAISFCQSIALLYYCPILSRRIFRERTISILQEFQQRYRFSKLNN
jgi:hypothetical protein